MDLAFPPLLTTFPGFESSLQCCHHHNDDDDHHHGDHHNDDDDHDHDNNDAQTGQETDVLDVSDHHH